MAKDSSQEEEQSRRVANFSSMKRVASWRAALRYGFVYEGTFRQYMIAKGRNRDNAWFSMLDSEWPARKLNFERWLALENFDSEGRQKLSLTALNGQKA